MGLPKLFTSSSSMREQTAERLSGGMELTGEPMDLLRRTLAGYIKHPNIAGAVVFSLGCERNNLPKFFAEQGLEGGKMLHSITMQNVGGTQAAVEAGDLKQRRAVYSGAAYLSTDDRVLLYGLGDAETVDRIVVRWPDGKDTEIPGADVKVDTLQVIRQAG